MEERAMIKVESFHSHHIGREVADVRTVVASATQQANETLSNWKKSGLVVNVLSAATQLALEGYDAAYVITLVVDLQRSEEDEDEIVTEEDLEFE
jgi:phage terminase Nu1 subunit (DNA packaging protein)